MCVSDVMNYLRRRLANRVPNPHAVPYLKAEPPPEIFKLTDACLNRIFKWLSMQELHAMGQTCKRLQRIAGEFFRKNYTATLISYNCDGSQVYGRELTGIGRYMQNISMWDCNLEKFLADRTRSTKPLKHIRLDSVHLPGARIEWTDEILQQVEILDLINCKIQSTFYGNFLVLCVNLKRLRLKNVAFSGGATCAWLQNKYPLLEDFELTLKKPEKIDELTRFFQQNTNIRRFSTNKSTLFKNRDIVRVARMQLNELYIEIDNEGDHNTDTMFEFLNRLYKLGIYKSLHLSGTYRDQQTVDAMATLSGLEKLNVGVDGVHYDISSLVNLKELNILWAANSVDMEHLAMSLVQLEKISFWKASLDDIIPFVRHSPRLNEIKIHNFMKNQFKACVCNDSALTKERKNLVDACKVTIFIEANILLSTKYETTKKYSKLVEIKRIESHEWGHHFLSY